MRYLLHVYCLRVWCRGRCILIWWITREHGLLQFGLIILLDTPYLFSELQLLRGREFLGADCTSGVVEARGVVFVGGGPFDPCSCGIGLLLLMYPLHSSPVLADLLSQCQSNVGGLRREAGSRVVGLLLGAERWFWKLE